MLYREQSGRFFRVALQHVVFIFSRLSITSLFDLDLLCFVFFWMNNSYIVTGPFVVLRGSHSTMNVVGLSSMYLTLLGAVVGAKTCQ
jgi:hypothetical protein